jgi:hypothetical protein
VKKEKRDNRKNEHEKRVKEQNDVTKGKMYTSFSPL